MDSYGAILRQAREAKKIDIETAARETSISSNYIEALESENTAAFHGEAYLVGFLRNYAEYLDVDAGRLINLYKNILIQEAPIPEGLIEKPRPSYFKPIIIASSFLVVIIVLVSLYFGVYRKKQIEKENQYAVSSNVQQASYNLAEKSVLNERVYVGDHIVVPTASGNVDLIVASDTNSRLALQTPVGLQYFELSETRELDVDGDSDVDIVVDVWEISSNDSSRGAEVYILLKDENYQTELVDATSIPVVNNTAQVEQTVILEDNRAYPFTLNATFRNPCVFRYLVDRKESIEYYYSNGDAVTMTANNKVRLWISNGNTVKFQVIAASQSYDLEIGKGGEVVVQDVKWVRTDDGKYRLVVENVE